VDLAIPEFAGGGQLLNPFTFDMGVRGIALGTLVAHGVGTVIILWMAVSGTWGIRLMRRRLRPHWHTLRRLVRLGVPNFAETGGMWFGNFLIMLMVGQLGRKAGVELMGAHIVAVRIESFSFMPGLAMGTAAATLVGQYLGAGSPSLARKSVMRCAVVACVVMGVLGTAFIVLPAAITGLLTEQAIHMKLTPTLIRIAGVVQIPFAVGIVYRSAIRGAGDVKAAMWLTWLTTYGVRLPLCYALSGVDFALPGGAVLRNPFHFEGGLVWLWVGLCSEMVIRSIFFAARFFHGGWTRARV
jgi:Na+-driven multidrug efflux pump